MREKELTTPHFDTQCLISHRPPARCPEPLFYHCPTCGALLSGQGGGGATPLSCTCGNHVTPLLPREDVGEGHLLTYTIFGGMAHNAIRIWVDQGAHPMEAAHSIRFLFLHTYEGGQCKYLLPGQPATATFALAGEDAYAYCDRPLCHMGQARCQFQCKRGWTIFAYCTRHGLRRLAL